MRVLTQKFRGGCKARGGMTSHGEGYDVTREEYDVTRGGRRPCDDPRTTKGPRGGGGNRAIVREGGGGRAMIRKGSAGREVRGRPRVRISGPFLFLARVAALPLARVRCSRSLSLAFLLSRTRYPLTRARSLLPAPIIFWFAPITLDTIHIVFLFFICSGITSS